MKIEIPWPHRDLMPNRAHRWGKAARFGYADKARKLRALSWGLIVRELGGIPQARAFGAALPDKIPVKVTFQPPEGRGRSRDEDGLMSALKPAFDGAADSMAINDSRFTYDRPEWLPKSGDGAVIITIAMED